MIYFIKVGNYVKIGVTNNIERRMRELQTGNVDALELLGVIDGGRQIETQIHYTYDDYRQRGEWFIYNDFIENEIDDILNGKPVVVENNDCYNPYIINSLLWDINDSKIVFKYWNDKLLYTALLYMSYERESFSVSITNIKLREMTGIVGHNSINIALERLRNNGWIQFNDGVRYYEILYHHDNTCNNMPVTIFNIIKEELNAQKAIGKAYQIIQLLNDVSKMSPKEISAEIGIGYSLTRDYIKKLFDLGLLERRRDGRQNIYSLSENYYEILQKLMVVHLVKNTQKINAEIERYNVLLDSKKEFDDTRDKYVENGTLETKLRELGNNEARK